jgi:hypothetical protein
MTASDTLSDSDLHRPMTTQEASDFLGVAVLTMEGNQ